jgi:hypothetical protein
VSLPKMNSYDRIMARASFLWSLFPGMRLRWSYAELVLTEDREWLFVQGYDVQPEMANAP